MEDVFSISFENSYFSCFPFLLNDNWIAKNNRQQARRVWQHWVFLIQMFKLLQAHTSPLGTLAQFTLQHGMICQKHTFFQSTFNWTNFKILQNRKKGKKFIENLCTVFWSSTFFVSYSALKNVRYGQGRI